MNEHGPRMENFFLSVLFINETLLYRFPFEDSFGQGKVAQAGGSRDKNYMRLLGGMGNVCLRRALLNELLL